jgi:UDP:flavonoid glycosyltransferase YjiC (YdhE family)
MDVLLVTVGSAGDVHPFIGLGQALRSRGHRVVVLTYPAYDKLVQAAGLEHAELPRPLRTPRESPPVDGAARLLDSALKLVGRRWRKLARRSTLVPLLRPVYDAVARHATPGKTVVVAHHLALGARVAQDHLRLPLATVHMSAMALRSVANPAVQPPLSFRTWAPRWWVRAAYRLADAVVFDRLLGGPVNALRAELGLPPVRCLYEGWRHSPQRVIGLFPEWFGPPQPDWPPQTRLTGFPLFDRGALDELAPEVRRFLEGPPPVVLTATSETRKSRQFFKQGVAACRRVGRRGLLLTRFREQVPDALPDGFLWTDYAPFSRVLPRAAAIVHHGGVGTAALALAAGAPQLVAPIGHDHFDNARRLERLGVAMVLRRRDWLAGALARRLDELIRSPEVAARCRECAGRVAAADALGEACRVIEELQPKEARAA